MCSGPGDLLLMNRIYKLMDVTSEIRLLKTETVVLLKLSLVPLLALMNQADMLAACADDHVARNRWKLPANGSGVTETLGSNQLKGAESPAHTLWRELGS